MTFYKIVRQWCHIYKPMKDSVKNGNKRFYLTDSKDGMVDLVKGLSVDFSPLVVMESDVEGGGPIRRPELNYPIYFFCRARDMAAGDCAAEAKTEAWYHAGQFLTWLLDKYDKEVSENIDGDFSRLNLDDAFLDIVSFGPVQDGWYAVLIQLTREEPTNLCIDENLYEDPDWEEDDDGQG